MAEEVFTGADIAPKSQFPQIEAYLHYSQGLWNFYRVRRKQEAPIRRLLQMRTEIDLAYQANVVIPEALTALQRGNILPAVEVIRQEAQALLEAFETRMIEAHDFSTSRTKAKKVCDALREVSPEEAGQMEERFRSAGVNFRISL